MTDADNKTRILNRLKRLEGQVRGLQRMVAEERSCQEVLTLVSGVRSALDATADVILENYLLDCQAEANVDQGAVEGIIAAVKDVGVSVPVVVRLEGTNVEKGRELLASSGLDIIAADDLTDAAKKAVAAAK